MTSDSIFSCAESPLKCPQLMDITRIYPCISCTLRLNAEVAGPGIVKAHPNGLSLDESLQTTLTVNGIEHNLIESFIYVPGAHRLPGQQEPYPMEIALYFRTGDGQKHICLCIPVQGGAPNPYFAALNDIVRNRPTVGSLVSPTSSIISYRGADMRGRDGKDSRPRTQCDPISRIVTYYVLTTPTTIAARDYNRLKGIAKDSAGPPIARTEIIESRYKLLSRIDGIKVLNKSSLSKAQNKDGGVDTMAMKCYRLDKDRDVVNDKVYIGGRRPGSTLAKELAGGDAAQADATDSTDLSVQPGDIEKWVGIIIGATIGILIIAFIIYIVWSRTFRDYAKVSNMHEVTTVEVNMPKVGLPNLKGIVQKAICPPSAT